MFITLSETLHFYSFNNRREKKAKTKSNKKITRPAKKIISVRPLPSKVIGLSDVHWKKLKMYATKRAAKVTKLDDYDFRQICSEELAERRVVIRHDDKFEDPLWKEKVPVDVGVMSKAFGVSYILWTRI